MSSLKQYIVTFKDSASADQITALKNKVSELGGSIVNEFSLIKGFTAKLPEVHTDSIKSHDHVLNVEEDQEVKIQ